MTRTRESDAAAWRRTAMGRRAEDVCADYLWARGFRIVGRNVRLGARELDIVARQDDLLAVVEVRTRGTGAFERPLASVSRAKQRHLTRATAALLRRFRNDATLARVRFDVAAVRYEGEATYVEHIEGAFVRG